MACHHRPARALQVGCRDTQSAQHLHSSAALLRSITELTEPRMWCRVPRTYLAQTRYTGRAVPEAPLIVFINSRSGGHAGPRLTEVLCRALGQAQVCTAASVDAGLGEFERQDSAATKLVQDHQQQLDWDWDCNVTAGA